MRPATKSNTPHTDYRTQNVSSAATATHICLTAATPSLSTPHRVNRLPDAPSTAARRVFIYLRTVAKSNAPEIDPYNTHSNHNTHCARTPIRIRIDMSQPVAGARTARGRANSTIDDCDTIDKITIESPSYPYHTEYHLADSNCTFCASHTSTLSAPHCTWYYLVSMSAMLHDEPPLEAYIDYAARADGNHTHAHTRAPTREERLATTTHQPATARHAHYNNADAHNRGLTHVTCDPSLPEHREPPPA